jgi:predicted ArsR family transcriptional regulator
MLTDAGDHLFPKRYDALNVAVMDAVADELGPEALTKVLERLSDARVAAVEPTLRGKTLEEKVALLKTWYLQDDPYMAIERVAEGDFLLTERNCPFLNTAMHRPALCSVSVNALTRLLGFRVRRDEKFQTGHGRCVFHVFAAEPIDAETWEFRPERPL